jgi:hypothetical protein
MIDHLQPAIGRNDINVVGFYVLLRAHFNDRHAGARGDDVHKLAAMLRIEMHNHHERGASIVRHGREKTLQGPHAAGRSANCGDCHG